MTKEPFQTIAERRASLTVAEIADGLCKPERDFLRRFAPADAERVSVGKPAAKRLTILFDHGLILWSADKGGKRTAKGDAVVAWLNKKGRV